MSFVTASLLEVPLPVTAALTSDGVWSATGMPRRAAAAMTTPDAWATPMTVLTFNLGEDPFDRENVGFV